MTGRKRGERGRSQSTKDLIQVSREIIEERAPIGVRGIAYVLFAVHNLIPDMSKQSTDKVSRLITDMREEGLVAWSAIVDESRTIESEPGWENPAECFEVFAQSYRRDFWRDSAYRVIVISEKATVSGLLRPVIDRWGVSYFPAHGFNSATRVKELVEEMNSDPRRYICLYCGDWDPSGMWMSEQDWFITGSDSRYPGSTERSNRLIRYGADPKRFTWSRIALTQEDLPGLPSFPAEEKKADPRYKWFIQNYGNRAFEIDALDPRVFRDRVEMHIKRYINPGAWQRHIVVEAAQRQSTRLFAAQMAQMGAE